jgi:hypothetical protein
MAHAHQDPAISWLDQNQAYLTAECVRLRDRLSGTQPEKPETPPESETHASALRSAMPSPPAIDVLAQLFALTGFERELLLLCARVDLRGPRDLWRTDRRRGGRATQQPGGPARGVVIGRRGGLDPVPRSWRADVLVRPAGGPRPPGGEQPRRRTGPHRPQR